MILFQIKTLFQLSVGRPPRFFYFTSKRDALQAGRKEFRHEDRYPPLAVRIRKIIFKDVPPKKLLLALLNTTGDAIDSLDVVDSISIVKVLIP
jgi:hypothetical protein